MGRYLDLAYEAMREIESSKQELSRRYIPKGDSQPETLTAEQMKQAIINEFDAVEICNTCQTEKLPHPQTSMLVCPKCHPRPESVNG